MASVQKQCGDRSQESTMGEAYCCGALDDYGRFELVRKLFVAMCAWLRGSHN
jgi:hypothetical protein